MKFYHYLVGFCLLGGLVLLNGCAAQQSPEYYSPVRNADYVSTGETITIRYGPQLTDQDLANLKFTVQGNQSGVHAGQVTLADDHKTAIFKPSQPYTGGEQVNVVVNGIQLDSGDRYGPLSYSFKVAVNQKTGTVGQGPPPMLLPLAKVDEDRFANSLTLPADVPRFKESAKANETGNGYIFVAPFNWNNSKDPSYLLILDNQGNLIYQMRVNNNSAFDFKVQPNGLLSYFSGAEATEVLLDQHYQVVDRYGAGNGYKADLHDFQILPNGNALLMVYDAQTIDMSQVAPGGKKDATVIGLVIQELDPHKNVVFEWRSWDHFSFKDSSVALDTQNIDLVHGNSLFVDKDGNILLSSRHQSDITKINRKTGEVMWRLGGKANMFTFTNDQGFKYQHDVRELANGNITLFDNRASPDASRALEYQLDEANKTVTKVWEYQHTPPVLGSFMGNVQRLENGNTLLSWGSPAVQDGFVYSNITEIKPDQSTVFELSFYSPLVSYRAFRFPWLGLPNTPPTIVAKKDGQDLVLGYSWNGATEVAKYRVYGGNSPDKLNKLDEKAKTGFETQSRLIHLAANVCYFQVIPVDKSGKDMTHSEVITSDPALCPVPR